VVPRAGRRVELSDRPRPTLAIIGLLALVLLLPVPSGPTGHVPPVTLPFVQVSSTALSANATSSDEGGHWNCGQGTETMAFFGRAIGGMPPYQYLWDFGDGAPRSSSQNPAHTYTSIGNFEATLTITDVLNASAITSVRPMWGVPTICSNAPSTYGGVAVYGALVSVVGVGLVWYVVRRRSRPPVPPLP
jgi:hypothetical protein